MARIEHDRLLNRIRAAIKAAIDRREGKIHITITVSQGTIKHWAIEDTRIEHSGMPNES
jgi:hypothetical protein